MASFGMEDVLHDEKGAQKYQRSPEDKVNRFSDIHEKAQREGLNSWKDCLSIRLDSVLLEKPSTPEEFEAACERAGVLIRQPRGKENKSWTQLKNWAFGLVEMNSEEGVAELRNSGIITDPKTKLHYVTDRGLGGTGRYAREGIEEALGWVEKPVEKPVEKTEKTVEPEPKPVETGISEAVPLYDLVADVEKQKDTTAPVVTEKPKTETKHEPKQEKGTPMKEDKFDPEEMHRKTVESIYSSTQMLMSMNGVGFDEALAQATKNLPDYRTDVRSMYLKEHPDAGKPKTKGESAAKPAKRSEQRSSEQKQQQPKQQQQAPKQQQREQLSPERLEYEMARDDAMQVLRRGEQNVLITLFTWWNLMAAERRLIQSLENGTDEQMDELRAADEAEYREVERSGSNMKAMKALKRRLMRDVWKEHNQGKKFLRKITSDDFHLTPEQKQMHEELQLNIAKRQQQGREMEL